MKPVPPKTVASFAAMRSVPLRPPAIGPPTGATQGGAAYIAHIAHGQNRWTTLKSPLTSSPPWRESRALADAQVAELVDAQVSGTCGRKAVEVRVFSWAPLAAARQYPGTRR